MFKHLIVRFFAVLVGAFATAFCLELLVYWALTFMGYSTVFSFLGTTVSVVVEEIGYGWLFLVTSAAYSFSVSPFVFLSAKMSKSKLAVPVVVIIVLLLSIALTLATVGAVVAHVTASAWAQDDVPNAVIAEGIVWGLREGSAHLLRRWFLSFPCLAVTAVVSWLWLQLMVNWQLKYTPKKEVNDDIEHLITR